MKGAQELFIFMFLLRGLPFVDLAYLRKSDLRGNVITYRRRKTGRPLSVTLTPEAMFLLQKYMNREEAFALFVPFSAAPKVRRKLIGNISWHCAISIISWNYWEGFWD